MTSKGSAPFFEAEVLTVLGVLDEEAEVLMGFGVLGKEVEFFDAGCGGGYA